MESNPYPQRWQTVIADRKVSLQDFGRAEHWNIVHCQRLHTVWTMITGMASPCTH
jgi:hypothetical protein